MLETYFLYFLYYLSAGMSTVLVVGMVYDDLYRLFSLKGFVGGVLLWPLFALAIVWKIFVWFSRSVTSGMKILKEFV